jgi:hypothetical protein
MSLIPIKLLKNGTTKNTLLNLKNESSEIDTDDYIESRIMTNSRARKLLAIEDASEMAKLYLHKKGIFEKIAEDLKKETGKEFTFHCRKTKTMKVKKKSDIEYVMMEIAYDNTTGHYGLARVNHKNKTARLYDSMVKDESDFKVPLEKVLTKRYKVTESKNKLQPTGGFVAGSFEEFKEPNYSGGIPKKLLDDAYELSQYDELSQHHFCYVESLLAMMNDMGHGDPGPGDPRDRLIFIKRVIWGLLHKYVPKEKRRSAQWKYFVKNFQYIMETRSPMGKRLRMVRGYVQVPPAVITLKKLNLRDDIDETWSLKRIVDWSA